MFGFVRAGGVSAVLVAGATILGATILGAGPSLAWDVSSATPSLQTPSTDAGATFAAPLDAPQNILPVQNEAPAAAAVPVEPFPVIVEPVAAIPVPVAVAVPAPYRTLAQLVSDYRSTTVPDRERECLAGAIYFEAKGESLPGQIAVGQVIANRAKSGRFPKTLCGVVFQRSQFSFVRGGALPPIPRASVHWKTAVAVAHIVANGMQDSVAPKALFFHARHVSPNWKRVSKVATVGNHVFYR